MSRLTRVYRRLARLDRYLYRRFTPLGRLVLGFTVVSGLFALDTRRTQSYQLFSLLLALLIVSFLLSLRRGHHVTVHRHLPALVTAGQAVEYELTVRDEHASRRGDARGGAVWLNDRLADRWPDDELLKRRARRTPGKLPWFAYRRWYAAVRYLRGAETSDGQDIPLGVDGMRRCRITLDPRRRGYVYLAGVQVGRVDPLGLCRAVRTEPLADKLLALPKRWPVSAAMEGAGGHQASGLDGVTQAAGQSFEFRGLREYRSGDSPRHIHWKAWARRGEPMVREYHAEAERRQTIVLDTFGEPPDDVFEAAVSIGASLVEAFATAGTLPRLILDGRASQADETLASHLSRLATVECGATDGIGPTYDAVVTTAEATSGIICVLTQWDESRQQLVRQMRALRLSVRVLLVGDGAALSAFGPMADCPERLVSIAHDALDEGIVVPA
jgi:uncharacterized protein (DUF58 family)